MKGQQSFSTYREFTGFKAFDGYRPLDEAVPEKNLMWTVLKTALDDLRKSGQLYEDAYEYLMDDSQEYLYAFTNVCEYFGFSPERIRRYLELEDDIGDRDNSSAAA